MRVLVRPPATVARVLGHSGVAPADVDGDGWYNVRPGALYWVRDAHGRVSWCVWNDKGDTRVIDKNRAARWAQLKELGATDDEADKLSVI